MRRTEVVCTRYAVRGARTLFPPVYPSQIRRHRRSTRGDFGARLRSMRITQDLTQLELAELSGLSQRLISLLEGGTVELTYVLLDKYAGALGLRVRDLLR